jgi:hypothetical protein
MEWSSIAAPARQSTTTLDEAPHELSAAHAELVANGHTFPGGSCFVGTVLPKRWTAVSMPGVSRS